MSRPIYSVDWYVNGKQWHNYQSYWKVYFSAVGGEGPQLMIDIRAEVGGFSDNCCGAQSHARLFKLTDNGWAQIVSKPFTEIHRYETGNFLRDEYDLLEIASRILYFRVPDAR